MTKNLKNLLMKTKVGLKTTIYLSLGLHKGFPSYRRSLQPSKENTVPTLQAIYLLLVSGLLEGLPGSNRSKRTDST
jgi:hypothetical protein